MSDAPIFADYVDRLTVVFAELEQTIGGMPQDGLNWADGPEENSLNVLVAHASGAACYWIGDIAAQIPSGRVRAHEFEAHGLNEQELKARLDAVLDFAVRRWLDCRLMTWHSRALAPPRRA